VHEVKQGWGQLFIGKISSFSSLMAGNKSLDRLRKLNIRYLAKAEQLSVNPGIEYNNEIIRLLKKEIDSLSPNKKPYFDLVIIDEAHYLRNKDGLSLRVNSAKIFFGDPAVAAQKPMAQKVLLLTATPNHSSSRDIKNIVSYFTDRFEDNGYKEILDKICIRRLRRLSSKALNKYNYRHERVSISDFKNKPLSEMFFGLYQHELAKEVNRNKKGVKGSSGMMKYLEGVEFLPTVEEINEDVDTNEDENKGNSTDYRKGSDAQMLLHLSKKYFEIFDTYPSHPKYEKLVEDLTQNHNGEKVVIFVRRIPSVQEISRRVIEFYDKRLWKIMQFGPLTNLSYERLDRKMFNKLLGNQGAMEAEESSGDNDNEHGKNIPSSRVLNLFKVVKNESPSHTAAANFRLRFTRSKPGVFSLFFSPGEDYYKTPYIGLISHRYLVGKEKLENYYSSALLHRTGKLGQIEVSKSILNGLLNKNPINGLKDTKSEPIHTLITIFWEVLMDDINISEAKKGNIDEVYSKFTLIEKEAFSNYLEKATLLASEAVVVFFEIFQSIRSEESDSVIHQYEKFCSAVKKRLPSLKLYKQIIESILHFRDIYTKVFSINNEKELLDESWDSFNNALPIYPYSADNSNQKVLRCFNTPFYPDILVATSVLQEGVNLQYFCNTVYHYGMAWTPGDNEQRIGRIDRMFGKIERLLEENHDSTLNIYYPYLKDTIDEEHLGRFAKRKYREEALIDLGKVFEDGSDYDLEENEIGGWSRFLKQPDPKTIIDPFPIEFDDFAGINSKMKIHKFPVIEQYYSAIINAIKEFDEFKLEVYRFNDDKSVLVDPTLHNKRKQPVIIELAVDQIGSGFVGSVVYALKMKTPLSSVSQFKYLKNNLYKLDYIKSSYPSGTKLCLDISQTGGSNWGIYMKSELPLFSKELKDNHLSVEDVQLSFKNLITASDIVEKEIFQKDLTKDDLNFQLIKNENSSNFKFRKADKNRFLTSWKEQDEMLIRKTLLANLFSEIDVEKKGLMMNHHYSFIKLHEDNGNWYAEVSIPHLDPHKEEMDLLEKHLDVFIQELQWQ